MSRAFVAVPGFPGYRVSRTGRVQSWRGRAGWRYLKPRLSTTGYYRVALRRDGKTHDRKVHHLVLEAFVGPCPEGMEGCHHPDPCRTNNRLENLRWDTPKSNVGDAVALGRVPAGEGHYAAKLTAAQVKQARDVLDAGANPTALAAALGVSRRTVVKLWRRQTWAGVV